MHSLSEAFDQVTAFCIGAEFYMICYIPLELFVLFIQIKNKIFLAVV